MIRKIKEIWEKEQRTVVAFATIIVLCAFACCAYPQAARFIAGLFFSWGVLVNIVFGFLAAFVLMMLFDKKFRYGVKKKVRKTSPDDKP